MNADFRIRSATPADVSLILRLIRALAVYEKMEDRVVATEDLLNEWIFEKRIANVMIAEADGSAVGFALWFHNFSTFLGRGGIWLEDLYVEPAYRGRGIGKQLLAHLAAYAVEHGCGRLEWCCLDWNEPSIRFYRSLGAESMDEWTTYRLSGETLTTLATQSKEA